MTFVADIKELQEHPPSTGHMWPSITKHGLSQDFTNGCSSTLRRNCHHKPSKDKGKLT